MRGATGRQAGSSPESEGEVIESCAIITSEANFERARVLALLAGLGADATAGVKADEAARFADEAVAALRAVVKGGWKKPEELKEKDSNSLRNRADFQKVVRGLGPTA